MSAHFGLAAAFARPPQQVLQKYHSTDSLPGVKTHVEGSSEITQFLSTPRSARSPKQATMMLEQVVEHQGAYDNAETASQSNDEIDDASSQGSRPLGDALPPWSRQPSPLEATLMLQEIIKQDSARRKLKEAIESSDIEMLRGSIQHGKSIGLSAEELDSGKSALERITGQDLARCNLEKAIESNDIEKLRGSIRDGENTGLLAEELDPAKSALEQIIGQEQQNEDQRALQAPVANRDVQRPPMSCQATDSDSGCAATEAPWDQEAARKRSRNSGLCTDRSGNVLQEALLTSDSTEIFGNTLQEALLTSDRGQVNSAVRAGGEDDGLEAHDLEAARQPPAIREHKSSSYPYLLAFVMLIAIVMPTVIWSLLAEKYTRAARLQAVLSDHTALLHSYSRRLDAEHSHRAQAIAAVNQRMDMLPSDWALTIAAFSESLAMERSDRAIALVAVNQSLAEVEQLVEIEGSNRKDSVARANQSVDTEHSESTKALEESFRELAAENSNRREAVAGVTQLVDQPQDDATITQHLDTEISDRRTSVTVVKEQMHKEISERKSHIAGLGQRINTVKRKIQNGMCTYCVTCGGQWPVSAGFVTHYVKDASRFGKKCHTGSPNTVHERKINFCCARVR